jgi:hypothetical protein
VQLLKEIAQFGCSFRREIRDREVHRHLGNSCFVSRFREFVNLLHKFIDIRFIKIRIAALLYSGSNLARVFRHTRQRALITRRYDQNGVRIGNKILGVRNSKKIEPLGGVHGSIQVVFQVEAGKRCAEELEKNIPVLICIANAPLEKKNNGWGERIRNRGLELWNKSLH